MAHEGFLKIFNIFIIIFISSHRCWRHCKGSSPGWGSGGEGSAHPRTKRRVSGRMEILWLGTRHWWLAEEHGEFRATFTRDPARLAHRATAGNKNSQWKLELQENGDPGQLCRNEHGLPVVVVKPTVFTSCTCVSHVCCCRCVCALSVMIKSCIK